MKILSLQIRKNGFSYTQVVRTDRKAIYRQDVSPNVEYFEVFLIRTRPERTVKGKLIPAGEAFPTDEDFGKTAWSFRSYEKALAKFKSLDLC